MAGARVGPACSDAARADAETTSRTGWIRRPSPTRDAAVYAALAGFAAVVAVLTTQGGMRTWAVFAVVGYCAGALASVALTTVPGDGPHGPRTVRLRTVVLGVVTAAVTIAPLAYLAANGISVSEVGILERAGARFLAEGTPYPDAAEIAAFDGPRYIAYNVYLPVLALFGIPFAVFGEHIWTDPRWFFALFACVALLATGRGWRPMLLVACTPPVALGLAIGSTELPVLALLCLGLTCAESGRTKLAGLAAGAGAAMKLHALPAVPVYFALVAALHGGRRATRFALVASGIMLACLVLPALVDLEAFVVNAIRLPLGLEPVMLAARSPLPGYLLSQTGPAGHAATLSLLGLAAVAMLVWLWIRRPEDVVGAARRLSVGWLLAMSLAPSTRLGYIVYPVVLTIWLLPRSLRPFAFRVWNPLRFSNPFRRSLAAKTGSRPAPPPP